MNYCQHIPKRPEQAQAILDALETLYRRLIDDHQEHLARNIHFQGLEPIDGSGTIAELHGQFVVNDRVNPLTYWHHCCLRYFSKKAA